MQMYTFDLDATTLIIDEAIMEYNLESITLLASTLIVLSNSTIVNEEEHE